MKRIRLTVNGRSVEAEVHCRTTLAELLRDGLGLTGTKVGCNRGECGSCTVLVDGEAMHSCTFLAINANGRVVTTVEGLSRGSELHPLQLAFIDHDALQCGYCTPGMLMSAKALLDRNPCPTEEQVRSAIDGNLCRCGCYPNIVRAVRSLAEEQ